MSFRFGTHSGLAFKTLQKADQKMHKQAVNPTPVSDIQMINCPEFRSWLEIQTFPNQTHFYPLYTGLAGIQGGQAV